MSSTSEGAHADAACAHCGKAEKDNANLNSCTACKAVKYCSCDCRKSHWPDHKETCEKRVHEQLFDEELCKQLNKTRGECPICMLPFQCDYNAAAFKGCCGKVICHGCIHAQKKEDVKSGKKFEDFGRCPFCRAPTPTKDDLAADFMQKFVEKKNADAILTVAVYCRRGMEGFRKDTAKSIKLFLVAGKLGSAEAYCNLGNMFNVGDEVEQDKKKAMHYYKLGAIGGSINARHNIACMEAHTENYERAHKLFLMCAKSGFEPSLKCVKTGFVEGYVTKDEYAQALRAYQEQQEETKSATRDEAVVYQANPDLYWENS